MNKSDGNYSIIKIAQYLSGLTATQDVWSEIGKALLTFLDLRLTCFGSIDESSEIGLHTVLFSEDASDTGWNDVLFGQNRISGKIKRMVSETLESGFLTTHHFVEPEPLAVAFLPITKEAETVAVLLFGASGPESFTKETLNVYLAVAGLVATTISRIDYEQEVQLHRQQLEELVQARTRELQQEITRRKQREEEKNVLMKELNHRVKNNLAMIVSLINLKDDSLGPEVDLSDLRYQIDAVRIIHEKLYKTDDLTHIEMRGYINSLLDTIFSSFTHYDIQVDMNIEQVHMTTKRAVPLGLLINEVATNALKHGFSDKREAVFTVGLRADIKGGRYFLELSNNGNPFPEDIDFDNPETLGLRLIVSLVEQLHGTIELQRNPHPRCFINFPMQEE